MLKAFSKSIFSKARLALLPEQRSNHARAVWTAASAPAGTATPTWAGKNTLGQRRGPCAERHLSVSRRSSSPIAIGRTPPFGLGTAPGWPRPTLGRRQRRLAPGQEVDDCRELLQQPFPGSRQEGVTEALRTKTGRPRRGGGWKGVL